MQSFHKESHVAPEPPRCRRRSKLEDCVICLDMISERAVSVPCNHCTFDFLCLVSWLQECSKCPLCKTDITEVQYDWRAPDDFKSYKLPPAKDKDTTSNARRQQPLRPRRNRHLRRNRPRDPSPTPDMALIRRRYVYRYELFSRHVGANRISCYSSITPERFTNSADSQSRARAFIRRELRVFLSSDGPSAAVSQTSNSEWLLEYIVTILKFHDLKGSSGAAEDMLQDFIGRQNARLFLHELGAWLRSPYTRLPDWDRHVQYSVPLPTNESEAERPPPSGIKRRYVPD
ncbi:uncharacterized protein IWZ02DRAFT_140076 [Phyllosticta citriasiana]|uniref:uncharacterized protein n=1 Tax=Phyllosticta citriasiana TaxID=595635 RepID=UPI0030FD99B3